jgi:hypothetical protein
MKKLIALTILLSGCVTIRVEAPELPPTVFEMACTALAVQYQNRAVCDQVNEPTIIVSGIVDDHYLNMFGELHGIYYPDEEYVFVAASMSEHQILWTSIHEVVHYIDYNTPEYEVTRCSSEEQARRISSEFVGEEYNDQWKESYDCINEE